MTTLETEVRSGPGMAIGAGPEQMAAIKAAQSQGLRVLAVDGDAHAPGLQVADLAFVLDLRDVDAVVALARAHRVCFTLPAPIGRLLTTQAAVHDALGLRGVRSASASLCTDKRRFHEWMQAIGVATPRQEEIVSIQALQQLKPDPMGFPLVLKPRCGSGSRGVQVVTSVAGWPGAVVRAMAEPPPDGWVLEPFIEGLSLGVDGAVVAGQLQLVLVREKHMGPLPNRVELAYRAPARLSAHDTLAVQDLLARALRGLEIDGSLFHADLILQPDGQPVLVELSARPSGLRIAADMVPACTGVDFLSEGLALHRLGQGNFNPSRLRPTLLHHWHHGPGTVERVPDAPLLLDLPHVLGARVGWTRGQRVDWPANVAELLPSGHLLVCAPTWEEVDSTLFHAQSLFKIKHHEST